MTALDFVLFCLAAVGATHIIVFGSVFEKARVKLNWSILTCTQCAGFHVGWIFGAYFTHDPIRMFLMGCVSSILSSITNTFQTYLEAKSIL